MIKINLCPRDELENPNWWVPDAALVAMIFVVGVYAMQSYENGIREEIATANTQRESYETSLAELKPDLDRATELKNDNATLTNLLNALQGITTSKIERFKPVIVLEHLQSLKPEGVWFNSLEMTGDNQIALDASAFDNLLVAEFAMAVKATQNQEAESSDLRTQVRFSSIKLVSVATNGAPTSGPNGELVGYPTFKLQFSVVEKPVMASAEPAVEKL